MVDEVPFSVIFDGSLPTAVKVDVRRHQGGLKKVEHWIIGGVIEIAAGNNSVDADGRKGIRQESQPLYGDAPSRLRFRRSPVLGRVVVHQHGENAVIPGLTGNLSDSSAFAVLVNHHPSKYGGAAESEPRRRIAVERLRFLADSLSAIGIDRIIAGGDFNDTPDNPVFRLLELALVPLHMDLYRRRLGTIKYDGKWDLIDQIYISPGWREPSMRILRIPFLLTRDTVHSGEKPLRTYTGPRHTGGVSDHLPVLLEAVLGP